MKKVKEIKNNGITLIALVITIIILIILAGVSISFLSGENSLLEKAKKGSETYEQAQAREKLQTVLLDLQADKVTDSTYNEEDYINNKLNKNDFEVEENIVIVDDWKFEIDRSVPEIIKELGKGLKNKEIKIELTQQLSKDHLKSTITAKIEYEGEIEFITIAEEKKEVVQRGEDNKYIVSKEVTKNGIYSVYVKDKQGQYNTKKIEVTDIIGNMQINSLEDLIKFRDNVNSGISYEGLEITLMKNLDMSSICSNDLNISWDPIGTETNPFKGKFNGNNYEIDGLYIDHKTLKYQGLFGFIVGSENNICEVKNLIMGKNCNIYGKGETGMIVGHANYTNISNCINNGNVSGYSEERQAGISGFCYNCKIEKCVNNGNISGYWSVGGIIGLDMYSTIKECYNTGKIGTTTTAYTYSFGGIIGCTYQETHLYNCYNIGIITGNYYVGGVVGCTSKGSSVEYCFNIKSVSGKGQVGSIVGFNSTNLTPYSSVSKCYFLQGTASNGCGKSSGGTVNVISKSASVFNGSAEGETSVKDLLNQDNLESVWTMKEGYNYPVFNWQ